MKNANRIIFLNILSTILIQGLAFISSPIFSRMMGTDNFGIYSIYNTWTMIVSAVFSLQVGSSLHIARARFPQESQAGYQSSILGLGTVIYLAFSAVVFLFLNQVSQIIKMEKLMILAMIVHSYGQFCVGFLNSKYTYEFKANHNFILSVVTSVCTVGISILLIYAMPQETNYWGRILGMVITYTALALVAWGILFPKGKVLFNAEYWRFSLRLGIPLVFHALSGLILSQSDRVMLQHMGTDSMVGIYSLAYTFGTILNVIWNALNNSWVPFYHEYTRTGQIEEMKRRARNYLELFTVLSVGFVLLGTEVYHVFADKTYWDGTSMVILFAIGYYMVFLYSFPVNYEFFHQKNTYVAMTTIAAALCNIVLNYFFIKSMGYFGAALATMIAHGLQFAFHYICARYIMRRRDFPFGLRMMMPYTIVFLAVAVFSMLTPEWGIIRWCLGAAIGVWELLRIFKRKAIF